MPNTALSRTTRASRLRKSPTLADSVEEQPLQLTFLTQTDRHHSNSIGLWEMVPWSVLDRPTTYARGDNLLRAVERSFTARGREYKVTLTPAQINDGDEAKQLYPGVREQRIELAIRKIATEQRAYTLESDKIVSVVIKIADIQSELMKVNHTMSYAEIERSLKIINKSILEIGRVDFDRDGDPYDTIMSSPVFPVLRMRKNRSKEKHDQAEVYIQLNDLISDAIQRLDFHDLAYATQMRLKPAALHIFRWLHHSLFYGDDGMERHREIRALHIQDICGMKMTRTRNLIARIAEDIEQLQEEGILTAFERVDVTENTAGRPRLIDAIFRLTVSETFIAQVVKARGGFHDRRERFELEAGQKPVAWVRPRDRKKRVAGGDQPTLDLIASR